MKFQKIRQQANLSVKIPGLSGGINAYDTTSEIEENQLVDANNMWWKSAALRTRPGMRYTGDYFSHTYSDMQWNKRQWLSDRETLILHTAYENGETLFNASSLSQDAGYQPLGYSGCKVYHGKPTKDNQAPTAFGCVAPMSSSKQMDSQTRYYFFLSNGDIIGENRNPVGNPSEEERFLPVEPYVPTVCIQGRAYQAMNLLTGKFKATFSPDGKTTLFNLPLENLTKNSGEEVTIEINLFDELANCMRKYSFSIQPEQFLVEKGEDVFTCVDYDIAEGCIPSYSKYNGVEWKRLYVRFNLTGGYFNAFMQIRYNPDSYISEQKDIPIPDINADTIVVTAWKTDESRRLKICKMQQCTWFGNSRLFVCGNPEEKNLVHWSDVNNPLYFPENNYVYVGDYSQSITAMRRQGELLAVFQENNLHGMTYALGDDNDYEFAKEAGVDATSVSMKVSMVSIHSGIGCDCPDSIRLVNNRLVWATSDGKVYMLPSVNQYSERNVREISRNISPLLTQHSKDALKRSFAGEFGGYYVLLVENTLYLLDAQNGAFSNFNYYSKEDTAQKALPWYRWTLPKREFYCMMANDTVMHLAVFNGNDANVYVMDGDTDEIVEGQRTQSMPIPCSFTTKMFDFDRPDKKKAVNQLYIGIGDSPESRVDISYITETGTYTDSLQLESNGDYGERDAGFMRVHRLTPNISRARVFGFRCDSEGAVSIGDIVLKFKEQGVVR